MFDSSIYLEVRVNYGNWISSVKFGIYVGIVTRKRCRLRREMPLSIARDSNVIKNDLVLLQVEMNENRALL